MENIENNSHGTVTGFFRNACMDCVFWYQCRKGDVDCAEKANMPVRVAVRA